MADDKSNTGPDHAEGDIPCLIKLSKICFSYPGSGTTVLDNLDLEIRKGDRIGMMAPNGSGKTTLFHIIMGLCRPQKGVVEIFGAPMAAQKDFAGIRTRIGLLFQDSDDQLFCPSVLEDVAFGPLNLGASKQQALETAQGNLERLGIADLGQAVTHRLSGGQKRLVALASVLAMSPEVLLLDEPTAGLDAEVKEKLVSVLNNLDTSYIVISHEFDFINAVTDRVFSMDNGRILTDEQIHIHRHEHVHRHGNRPHSHK